MSMRPFWTMAIAITLAAFWAAPAARAQGDSSATKTDGAKTDGAKTDGEKAAEPPPKHGLTKADDEAKAVYETVRKRIMTMAAVQVTSLRGQKGFGLTVGASIAPMLETSLWGYRYSGDAKWLDKFVELMTALEKSLVEDPDGHLGWYSAPAARVFGESWPAAWPNPAQQMAWQQAEARVIAACADFELTVRDDEELKDKYLATAKRWTQLAEEKLLPKWKADYAEISQDRAIFAWPAHVFAEGKKEWEPFPGNPSTKAGLTLPHSATSEIILRDLKLWQLRGDKTYRNRAAKLLRWQKSCLRFYRGGQPNERGIYGGKPDKSVYFWNVWDPATDEDFRAEGGLAFGMYMGLEPLKYGRDIEAFVEAYHTATVIDQDDLKRLIETQTKRMMTGDTEKPTWKDQRGEKRGMLWAPLAEFDERLDYLVRTTFDPSTNEFGSKLRFLQEKPFWGDWKRRKQDKAEEITCNKTHEDFQEEMDELMKRHPPPDPRKPRVKS